MKKENTAEESHSIQSSVCKCIAQEKPHSQLHSHNYVSASQLSGWFEANSSR